MQQPEVAVVMGSRSDWDTMSAACDMLDQFNIAHHVEVVSAHRTPEKLFNFAKEARQKGFKVIIAGAGGAAHLPGMIASSTPLPVLGVPVQSKALSGWDSLLSIVQMPRGVAVGSLAIGNSGAANAGLLAAQILALQNTTISEQLDEFRSQQTETVLAHPDPREEVE